MHNVLHVHEITKRFQGKDVLNSISCSFTGGQIYGLVGPNGCGKTVFLKCLCGLLPLDHGEIRFNGFPAPPPVGTFGAIIESPGFLANFSGYTNLKMLASLRRRVHKEEIMHILRLVELDQVASKKVGKYSLGMRQRLGIAQALLDDPPVLLLDEPFNALDQSSLSQAYVLIKELREKGKIIILASHHKEDIEQLCDVVYVITNGGLQMR